MKALLIGATGATGKALLNQLLNDENYSEVRVFVRRPTAIHHAKLKEFVVDFNDLSRWKNEMVGDVAFLCLGTTIKQAGSKTAMRTIDLDYVVNFSRFARENGVQKALLVSSSGANRQSCFFYPRLKGEVEEALLHLNFPSLAIFRPSILVRPNSDRMGEEIVLKALLIFNRLGIFQKYRPMSVEILAEALRKTAKKALPAVNTFVLDDIFKIIE